MERSLGFYYPSALSSQTGYLRDHVLLEFGVRNSVEPCEARDMLPLLSSMDVEVEFQKTRVNVLSPIRTFWEKATLIHVECHRGRLLKTPDRLSRHWYDLAMLSNSWVFNKAFEQREVLLNVIEHKKAFFAASYTNYDACLNGSFKLVPADIELKSLSDDCQLMMKAGMFASAPPQFDQLIHVLSQLEEKINGDVA